MSQTLQPLPEQWVSTKPAVSSPSPTSAPAAQWLRKITLIVSDQFGNGIDLSELHIIFSVRQPLTSTPTALDCRVFNLSETTAQIIAGFVSQSSGAGSGSQGQVILAAGYESNFGTIFQGNLIQTRKGRVSGTDTYLDIVAREGDTAHNWAVVNKSLAAGYTPQDVANTLYQSMSQYGVTQGPTPDGLDTTKAPRGRVLYGMTTHHLSDFIATNKMTWGIYGGQFTLLARTAFKPGEAVVLNSASGLIGYPQQTQEGIMARCLLNPAISVGSQVQINNSDIVGFKLDPAVISPENTPAAFPSTTDDGFYKVLWANFIGDTRGNEWYTDMALISVTGTAGAISPESYISRGGISGSPSGPSA